MTSSSALLLARASYFSPSPVLTIDTNGLIIDFNLATQVLMHPEIEGARYQPADRLIEQVRDRVEGELLPLITSSLGATIIPGIDENEQVLNDLYIDGSRCRFCSRRFGWTELRRTAVGLLEASSGNPLGTIIYLEIQDCERKQELRGALSEEYHRQLTWNLYAISYDRILPLLPFYQDVVGRHVETMSAPHIRNILDVGAGTGNVVIELLKAGKQVTAVDISRAMLEKLHLKVPDELASQLKIVEQNAESLSQWTDGEFDGVTVLLSHYDMANPTSALHEAMRTLRPGGDIVITEPKRSFKLEPLLEFVDNFLRSQGLYDEYKVDWERVAFANKVLNPGKRGERLWVEDISEKLKTAGFRNIRTEDSHLGNCATLWARKPEKVLAEVQA